MATYKELFELRQNSEILNKITTAIAVKCKIVIDDGTATSGQKDWARGYYKSPGNLKSEIIWPVLEANKGQSVANIENATDASIQTNVNNAINDLISAL